MTTNCPGDHEVQWWSAEDWDKYKPKKNFIAEEITVIVSGDCPEFDNKPTSSIESYRFVILDCSNIAPIKLKK